MPTLFLDPPFDQVKYKDLLRRIFDSNAINEGGKIFLETNKHNDLQLNNLYSEYQ